MDYTEPTFSDALFYQKRKHGKYRVVAAPTIGAAIADTHAHIQMLPDPALFLAKALVWGVDFVCDICDVCEDADTAFENLSSYQADAIPLAHDLVASTLSLSDDDPVIVQTKEQIRERISIAGWDDGVRIRIAVGCHPHNAKDFDGEAQSRLKALLSDARVCAIGEIGLDYHYDFSPRPVQIEVFRAQIRMAHEFGLPISLHIREAHDEAFRILVEEGFPKAGVLLHCFNLDAETLEPWLEHDCFVAFGGPLTFKASDYVREAARLVPTNRLLTETDAPYMAPEPMRGVVCGPQHTVYTADVLARTLGCETPDDRAALFGQLMENAKGLLDRAPLEWQRTPAKDTE
ncbi:MAG: TatD family hydrolase [Eggerthellaceae bacterium]|nr:TatD family hydrolase [Eggerthellaceae bacterium]